ncbi:methyltransferase domain-containing protein [Nonomuraea sp. NPDC050310]|uniref:protein-L-isoaspartate O-methyltransferase family protein n=1 Tax=Nonomuraea sp. NPDC050310 TaxID=3154935 RepID=UPI0033CF2B88
MDWKQEASALASVATPPGSRRRGPVESTPRHVLVPNWWAAGNGGWRLRRGQDDVERWLSAAYRDRTLVTRVGPLHADDAAPGTSATGRATSSSTLPSLVVQMYRHASIADHDTVLDVGTGSGYGTAVLCARLGDARVTAIDIDQQLNDAAADRLDTIGHRPRILTGDAAGPLDGQWDRIVAMVAMPTVPPSWLDALPTGGRLATTLADMGLILTAEKLTDGTAAGRVERDQAAFMHTRTGDDYPPRDLALRDRALVEDGEHVEPGRYPVLDVVEAWDVHTMISILAPGTQHHYAEHDDGRRVAVMTHADGSWARAVERDGRVLVHQSGPRRL